MLGAAAGVADAGGGHAVGAAELGLDAPEAAGGEDRGLGHAADDDTSARVPRGGQWATGPAPAPPPARRRARRAHGWSRGRWPATSRAARSTRSARSRARPRAREPRSCGPASRSATPTCRSSAPCSRTPGDEVVEAGEAAQAQARESSADVRTAAILLGLAVWLVPSLPLLFSYGPARLHRGRETRALRALLATTPATRTSTNCSRSARSRTCPTTACERWSAHATDRVLADVELAREGVARW